MTASIRRRQIHLQMPELMLRGKLRANQRPSFTTLVERKKKENRNTATEKRFTTRPALDGVIAHLTRECGGTVRDKRIVHVMRTSYAHRQAFEFGDEDSSDANSCSAVVNAADTYTTNET